MDLNKLDSKKGSEEGKVLEIILSDGTETGIKIKLMGVDSKTFKAQSLAIRKYVKDLESKGRKPADSTMDAKSIDMLVASTMDWEGVEEDGAIIKFNAENAEYIYGSYPIIADQVAAFIMDRSNFLGE